VSIIIRAVLRWVWGRTGAVRASLKGSLWAYWYSCYAGDKSESIEEKMEDYGRYQEKEYGIFDFKAGV
jgi:hypothetical protein